MKLIKSLSNDARSEMEQQGLKQGVHECIEFLKCHATMVCYLMVYSYGYISGEKRQLKMFGSRKRQLSSLK